jgi:hypothetical protein
MAIERSISSAPPGQRKLATEKEGRLGYPTFVYLLLTFRLNPKRTSYPQILPTRLEHCAARLAGLMDSNIKSRR